MNPQGNVSPNLKDIKGRAWNECSILDKLITSFINSQESFCDMWSLGEKKSLSYKYVLYLQH